VSLSLSLSLSLSQRLQPTTIAWLLALLVVVVVVAGGSQEKKSSKDSQSYSSYWRHGILVKRSFAPILYLFMP